jgi:hypothetical protein
MLRTDYRGRNGKKDALIALVLGLVFLVVYLACPNVRNNGDVPGWANYLEEYASARGPALWATGPYIVDLTWKRLTPEEMAELGPRQKNAGWWVLWNPHHLLFLPVTATVFRLIKQILPMLGGITFLQWWNSVAGALILVFLYRLLMRLRPGSPYVLPWIIFLGTSVTFFKYATDGSQHPTSVLFLVLGASSLRTYAERGESRYLVRSGMWVGLSVLFHQIAVLTAPFLGGAVFLLIRGWRREGRDARYGRGWAFLGGALGIPIAAYILVGGQALGSTGEFNLAGITKYVMLYATHRSFWSSSISEGFVMNLTNFVGFYFGGQRTRDVFFIEPLFMFLTMMLPAIWLTTILTRRQLEFEARWWVTASLFWILPYLIFLSVWVPRDEFFHLFLIVPMSSLVVLRPERAMSSRLMLTERVIFWGWCLIGAVVNLPESLSGCLWVVK